MISNGGYNTNWTDFGSSRMLPGTLGQIKHRKAKDKKVKRGGTAWFWLIQEGGPSIVCKFVYYKCLSLITRLSVGFGVEISMVQWGFIKQLNSSWVVLSVPANCLILTFLTFACKPESVQWTSKRCKEMRVSNQPNCRAQNSRSNGSWKTIIDLMEGGKKKSEEIKLKPHRHVDEHQRNYNSQLACART